MVLAGLTGSRCNPEVLARPARPDVVGDDRRSERASCPPWSVLRASCPRQESTGLGADSGFPDPFPNSDRFPQFAPLIAEPTLDSERWSGLIRDVRDLFERVMGENPDRSRVVTARCVPV